MIVTLLDRVALRQDPLDDGVTTLVVGDDRLLRVRDDPRLALRAGDDPLQGFLELGHADDLLVAAGRQDRGLVDEVREVGAGEARRLARDAFDIDALVERLALGVDPQDLGPATHVGPVEDDLAVEAARAQERRVEDVRSVGGGDDDHVRVRVEAVHLDEDLVEGLLALVVRAAETGATLAADRVDLVDEDDARGVALGLVEQVAHAARADADEHLDELGAGDAEERHAGLTRDGASHQGLAGAGRPDEQHAAGDARAERVELLGELQELDDLLELGLGLVDAGHVRERDDGLVAEEHARPALAEAERLVIGALRLAHHEEDEATDDEQRQDRGQQQPEPRGVGCRRRGEHDGRRVLAALLGRLLDVAVDVGQDRRDVDGVLVGALLDRQGGALLGHLLDLSAGDVAEELRIACGDGRRARRDPGEQQRCRPHDQDQHHDAVSEELGVQEESLRGEIGRRSSGALCGEYSVGPERGPLTDVPPLNKTTDGWRRRMATASSLKESTRLLGRTRVERRGW